MSDEALRREERALEDRLEQIRLQRHRNFMASEKREADYQQHMQSQQQHQWLINPVSAQQPGTTLAPDPFQEHMSPYQQQQLMQLSLSLHVRQQSMQPAVPPYQQQLCNEQATDATLLQELVRIENRIAALRKQGSAYELRKREEYYAKAFAELRAEEELGIARGRSRGLDETPIIGSSSSVADTSRTIDAGVTASISANEANDVSPGMNSANTSISISASQDREQLYTIVDGFLDSLEVYLLPGLE